MPRPPRQAEAPIGASLPFEIPEWAPSFDANAFDAQIHDHGVRYTHWRALRCPVGLVDDNDSMRRPHEHHAGCSNGFLYVRAGTVYGTFMGNGRDPQYQDWGRVDASTAAVTFTRTYADAACTGASFGECPCSFPMADGSSRDAVELCQYDRLYLDEESVTVVNWHTFTVNESGKDRLQFPVVKVTDMVDSRNVRYTQGVEFNVVDEQIEWVPGKGPGRDPASGRGLVCTARYTYRPYYYVERMIHEIRVAQIVDASGRTVMRMPQAALLKREFHYQDEQRDDQAPDPGSLRQQEVPARGGFGKR